MTGRAPGGDGELQPIVTQTAISVYFIAKPG